jgi:4-hydroxy-3-polyprenylbenzoate decarboxylase
LPPPLINSEQGDKPQLRLVVAITGASGVIYGIRALEVLKDLGVETHLIMSEWGAKNIKIETDKTADYAKSLATKCYEDDNMAAPMSSGSFRTDGMAVIPCSMKTLASIANAFDDSLVSRAAGVCIKEQRKLVLVPRETPLSKMHLDNMSKLADAGAVILPAMPGFYHRPKTMDDLIDHVVGKVLDQFNIDHGLFRRWGDQTQSV